MKLTEEHLAILEHTRKNGLYCEGSKEMTELCDFKMMEYAGRKPFVPDPYFRLLPDGESALDDLDELKATQQR